MTCGCHGLRLRLGRCPVTGHRQPVLGVPPLQTRTRIFRAVTILAVVMAGTEIAGRLAARHLGAAR